MGWVSKFLGDACEVIAGQSPAGSAYNMEGRGIPFYQGKKEFEDKHIGPPTTWTTEVTKLAQANDILMSVRAPVGPINFATQDICIGRGLAAIRAKAGLDQNFLFYFLLSIQSQISGRDGAVFPSISRNEICSISLPIPPLPEQQRIVTILDKAFVGLATAADHVGKNLKNAREIFENYLASIFMKSNKSPTEVSLSEVCDEMTVGHVGPMAQRYKGAGIPFLRSQNIRPFEIDLDGIVYIDQEFHNELAKSQLRPDDIAIVRTGYPGTAAVVPRNLPVSNCADLVIVRVSEKIDPRYVVAFFNSAYGKRLVGGNLNGAAQKHFNVTAAKAVKLPIPPKADQEYLSDKIEELRARCLALEATYEKKLKNISEVRQSILKKAFSGDLRSPPSQIINEAAE